MSPSSCNSCRWFIADGFVGECLLFDKTHVFRPTRGDLCERRYYQWAAPEERATRGSDMELARRDEVPAVLADIATGRYDVCAWCGVRIYQREGQDCPQCGAC